jgi:hypothetical protein
MALAGREPMPPVPARPAAGVAPLPESTPVLARASAEDRG